MCLFSASNHSFYNNYIATLTNNNANKHHKPHHHHSCHHKHSDMQLRPGQQSDQDCRGSGN